MVTTAAGAVTLPGAFTYVAAPTTSGITPAQGPVAGGTLVTITGTDLIGATVTLCGRPASNVIVNPAGTQITATTPPGSPGTAAVTVTTPGGTATLACCFTYQAVITPHATSLTATPALIQLFPLQLHFPFLTATLTDTVTDCPSPARSSPSAPAGTSWAPPSPTPTARQASSRSSASR
ncbi:hypothetical protein G7Z12_36655 [Streptomyces sp. ID38640]|uniref:IPT/TIG domain-containing protein n=1 Tax=Streptomyces sp. ID38640 TaxID=1265399 RepID=UPI00140EF38B|nr:IPT/TIG domain-containing protein [Streptomyces sp. ID38640]QIK10773.1 hypothetical protein G7Z12_36655 [Streptomyces sp. ID38640]